MKRIYLLIIMTVALVFTGCGGGGGSSSFQQKNVDITVTCIVNPTTTDFNTYHTLYSGDKIVNTSVNTSVTTYHNINGEKKVCLNSGSAYIVRK